MANSITTITTMLHQIADTIYGHDSLTSILDTQSEIITGLGSAKTVKVPRMALDGLSDYDKANGYSTGDVTLDFVPYTLTKDRGKRFVIDAVDDIETAGLTLSMLESTFVREKVVPEIDAYRFAQYATGAGTKASLALDETSIEKAIDVAIEALFEAGAPEENRLLYISSDCYTSLKEATKAHRWSTGTVVNRNVTTFDDIPVIKVPRTRFKSAVTLGTNGYSNPSSALDINFILLDKNAVLQMLKHNPSNIITPDANQTADGWIYKYRAYHDALVKDGKTKGIYAHTVPKVSG